MGQYRGPRGVATPGFPWSSAWLWPPAQITGGWVNARFLCRMPRGACLHLKLGLVPLSGGQMAWASRLDDTLRSSVLHAEDGAHFASHEHRGPNQGDG